MTTFEENSLNQEEYYRLKNIKQEILKQIDLVWNNAKVDKNNKKCSKQKILTDKILNNLILACVNLQANSIYYSSTENQRNDYMRDLLETSGYNVKDQTKGYLTSAKQSE